MMFVSWYQLKAILWKNWLEKYAHFGAFLVEILLPVVFMALLILIKQITTKYDSPNVAFYCGQTYPWLYSSGFDSNQPDSFQLLSCLEKPKTCSASNYYEHSMRFKYNNTKLYDQYGYTVTPSSNGKTSYPFYAFTIADESSIFNYGANDGPSFENPSLPFCTMIERIHAVRAILVVAPSAPELLPASEQLYQYFNSSCNATLSSSIQLFPSESYLTDYVKEKDYDKIDFKVGKVAFAVVLNEVNIPKAQWDYKIRVNWTIDNEQGDPTVACLYDGCKFTYTIPPTTDYTYDLYKPVASDWVFGYSHSGFLTLQLMVDKYIFSHYNNAKTEVMASIGLMPTQHFKSDTFQYVISSTLGIFYILSFLYPVSRLIRALTLDKELKIKEGMKMMGLTDTIYNLSWLITTFLQFTLIAILITLVTGSTVFAYSDKIYVFIFFEAFSLAVIMMCFLVSTFFSRSKTASLLGPMIFFASFFPYYAVSGTGYSESAKTSTCLLAPACFALGAEVFAQFEGGLVGIQAGNTNVQAQNLTYNLVIGMLFVDVILYGILAWYLDKALPSEFGTSLPFYFPLMPSYWFGSTGHSENSFINFVSNCLESRGYSRITPRKDNRAIEDDLENIDPRHAQFFESVSHDLKQQVDDEKCISIRHLRKVFQVNFEEEKVAVDNLNLDMYQNQVTVMLGHNGAGKTTTISMLVGMIPVTSGTAKMPGGLDITHDMASIRRNMGVCPQHDILFPDLTALQHLEIFAAFKGVSPRKVREEAKRMLAEVGLKEKAKAKSSTLSGGQKRKLSLGIALIGDSKVVILDEPTSGMDPYSRRSTWNIIQRNKRGRVILLTTHFLDEAESFFLFFFSNLKLAFELEGMNREDANLFK